MKLIHTKTLESISQHKNKIVRLAAYLLESDSDYIIQKMGQVTPDSDMTDVVSSINQDLASTAKFVNSLAKAIQTVDENDVSIELDNGETNFSKIFPNHYKDGEITIFGVKLSRLNGSGYLKPEDIKRNIFQNAFPGHKFENFKALVKTVNKAISQGNVSLDMPFEERLSRAATVHAIESYKPFIDEVLESAELNFKVRMQMTDKEKKIVDQEVMGGRAMIDGVANTSTHIQKAGGIIQVSSSHKKQPTLLSAIKGMVDELPYLKGVEIDADTDLQKFHDMIKSLKGMRFSNADPFEIKSRKLGNYGASGLNVVTDDGQEFEIEEQFGYANNMLRIVAVDVRMPTSLAHELSHYSDTSLNVSYMIRSSMVKHFGSKIDTGVLRELYGDKTANYIMNDREIVARMGEIGFLLNQIGVEDGDTINDAVRKARKWESEGLLSDGEGKFDVAIVKSLEEYMAVEKYKGDYYRQESYFNMAEWTPEELTMVKDYAQGLFFDMQPEVQKELENRLQTHQAKLTTLDKITVKRANKRRTRTLSAQDIRQKVWGVLKQDPKMLSELLDVGKRDNLFEDGEFSYYATLDLSTVFAGSSRKRSLDRDLITLQYENYANLANSVAEKGHVAELSIIQFGSGSMANGVNKGMRPDTHHSEALFVMRKISSSYSGDEQDNGFKALQGLRTTGWNSLSSPSGYGEKWREHIKAAYDAASEGLIQHSVGAELHSVTPAAKAAFITSGIIRAGQELSNAPEELALLVQEDAFNMGVIAFSDKDRMAERFDALAVSGLHQELFDTSNFMFSLGDRHVESELASQMIDDGFASSLGMSDEQFKEALSAPEIQNNVAVKIGQNEAPAEYLDRLENHHFDQEAGLNYHDRYGRMSEVVENELRTYGGKQTDLSIRTSPVVVLSYIAQKAKGFEGVEVFMRSAAKAIKASPKVAEMTEDIANANIAHFNYVQMKVRDGASYTFSTQAGTPESVIVENMMMKGVKPHKDSKMLEYKPTEHLRDMLKVKLLSDYISLGNPDKEYPMAIRAVKPSNSSIERRSEVRVIPVGVSPEYHCATSTAVTMSALNTIVGSVASKVNTPDFEKEILTERGLGRNDGIEFQKTIDNLVDSVGVEAYKAFEFSQRSDINRLPFSPHADTLKNLWVQMSNNLIQYHQDAFTSLPEMVAAKEMEYALEIDAQRMREQIRNMEISNAHKQDIEPEGVVINVKPEEKPEAKEEPKVEVNTEPQKPVSQTPHQMKMF